MSGYNVTATLSAKDKNFTSQMRAAIGQLEDMDRATGNSSESVSKMGIAFGVASGVIAAAMSTVGSCVDDAVKRFDTLEKFPKVMSQIGFDAEDASKATKELTEGIQGLPTSLSEITANTQSLALLTGDLEEATELSIALNDAFLASGSSSEDASRGLTQYTQMLSAGKVDMQSWKTLLETMGVALNDVAAELGYTGSSAKNDLYSALQSGDVTFDEFNDCLVQLDQGLSTANGSFVSFADRALTASEGIGTSMQNIRTAVVTGLANMVTSIDTAMQEADLGSISSNLNGLKGVVSGLFSTINSAVSGVVSLVAPVFKTLSENMDLVAISAGAMATKFVALKVIDSARRHARDFQTAVKNSSETIREYNDLLGKYGSKQKAAAAAEEATTAAKEMARKAAVAQEEAEQAVLDAKQKAVTAMSLENHALESGASAQRAKELALEASTEATEAQITAEQKKIDAERLNAQATQMSAGAEQAQNAAQTLSNTQISLKTALLGVLSGQTSIATAAQQAFNAALSANPIGFIITAVTTLISVFSGLAAMIGTNKTEAQEYAEEQEEVRKALEESAEALEESTSEHETNIAASKKSAEEAASLVGEIEELQKQIEAETAAGKDSSAMKAELKSKLSQLNSTLGDTAYEYDETTNALSANTSEMKAYVKQVQKNTEVNELLSEQSEIYEELTNAQVEVANAQAEVEKATEEAAKAQEEYDKINADSTKTWEEIEQAMNDHDAALFEANEKEKEAQKTLEEWGPKVDEYQASWEETSEKVATAQDELKASQEAYNTVLEETANDYSLLETAAVQAAAQQYQANQEMIASSTIAYEQLSEKNQGLVDSLQSMWDGYYESASNMWEVLKDEETLSVDEMIANLQTNQQTIETMASNMGSLRDRFAALGLDTAVLDQFDNMGIEASSDVAALVQASDEQLQTLATTFGNAATTSTKALTDEFGAAASSNIPDAIRNMVETTHQGLAEQIAAADWAELGEAQMEGIIEGVEGMTDDAVEASTKAATEGYKGYQGEIQSGSPSRVYADLGVDQMTGLILGINKTKGQVTSLMRAVAQQSQTPFQNLQPAFQSYGMYAMQGFINGLNSQRSSVASTAASIARAASETIASALQIGSPSRLLYKYGAWAGEGLENGLESRERSIERVAGEVAGIMNSVFIPQVSDYKYESELAITGGVSYHLDELSEDLGRLVEDINARPIVVQNDLAIDGRSFAKSTATYTQAELNRRQLRDNRKRGNL